MRLDLYIPRFLCQIWIFSLLAWSHPTNDLQPRGMTAASLFQLTPPDKSAYCHGDHVNTIAKDALQVLKGSSMALSILLQNRIKNNKRNLALSYMATTLWNVQFYSDDTQIHLLVGSDTLSTARTRYKAAMTTLHQRKFILTCGAGQWRWGKTFGEAGITPWAGATVDTPLASYYKEDITQVPGYWVNSVLGLSAAEDLADLDHNHNPKYPSICKQAKGISIPEQSICVLCDPVLDETTTTPSLKAARERQKTEPDYASLDDQDFAAITLVHELMHLSSNNEITDEKYMDTDGQMKNAYGYAASVEMALQGKSLTNADNYANFGLMVALLPTEYLMGYKSPE